MCFDDVDEAGNPLVSTEFRTKVVKYRCIAIITAGFTYLSFYAAVFSQFSFVRSMMYLWRSRTNLCNMYNGAGGTL